MRENKLISRDSTTLCFLFIRRHCLWRDLNTPSRVFQEKQLILETLKSVPGGVNTCPYNIRLCIVGPFR